jgi:DNA-binding winged helix-turn-helix (wHTH) protein/tetratricopeptide (TPR) repeat protein
MHGYRFGPFHVDLRAYSLTCEGRVVALERRGFDLLVLLLQARDRVVSKSELMDALWHDCDVGESTLTRIVSVVRKSLSARGSASQWIRTAHRRGYQFAGDAVEISALPAVPEPGIVGRARELSVLEGCLARALEGRAQSAWLEGPTGIGKTALCRALEAPARERGFRVVRARCGIVPGAPSLWPWIQLVRQLLAGRAGVAPAALGASQVRPAGEDAGAAELGRLVGARDVTAVAAWTGEAGARATAPEPADVSHARFDLFDCTAELLRSETTRTPLLIVLDDLHWCDAPSLRLLEFVVRHLDDVRAVLVGCLRYADRRTGAPLADALGAAPSAVHQRLVPLTREATEAWLRSARVVAPESVAAAIHERTAGNPLFIQHMVRSLEAAADPHTWVASLAEAHAPRTLVEVVRREIDALSPGCVRLLQIGSVMGRELSLSIVASVDAASVAELLGFADEACTRGVLEPVAGAADRYRFAHPLSCDALYDRIPLAERARWHIGIACALESEPETAEKLLRIAHHLWQARPAASRARVRDAQARAARRAMRALSFDDAVHTAERALELGDGGVDPGETIELLLLLGRASHLRGDELGMRRAYLRASEASAAIDRPELMAQAALGFSSVGSVGRLDAEWVALVEDILVRLGPSHPHLCARLVLRLSLEYYWAGHRERGERLSAEGERIARTLVDPLERATALDLRLALCRGSERLADALARADEILALLKDGSTTEIEVRARLKRYEMLLELCRIAEAEIEYRAIAARAEALRLFWPTRVVLMRALMQGRHDEVERSLGDSIRSGRLDLRASGEWTQSFMVVLFQLRMQQGRLPELLADLSGWVARFPEFPGARVGLALAHARAGHVPEARALVAPIEVPASAEGRDQTWLWLLAMLAETHVEIGHRAALPQVLAALLPYADRVVALASSACLGSAAYFLGRIALALGRAAEAVRHLERSLDVDTRLGHYLRARTLTALAEARAQAGDRAGERAGVAREALALSEALGVADLATRARAVADAQRTHAETTVP